MNTSAHVGYKAEITIDGVKISMLNIRVLRLPPLEVPARRVTEIIIPGREETLTETDGVYLPMDKKARLFYEGSDPLGTVKTLRSAKKIEFSNEEGFVYDCRTDGSQQIPRMIKQWHAFDWVWRCQPLKRQKTPASHTGTTLSLLNLGNEPARPKIEITGTGNVSLNIGGQTVALTAIGGGKVTIDSELRQVHQNGLPIDHKMTGDFPVIPVSATAISITATGTISLMTVFPNWRWS